jgi:tRNA (mo5U34)-methyltransferase
MLLSVKPELDQDRIQSLIDSASWYHKIELLPGLFTPGVTDVSQHVATQHLPKDCSGMRVLDIGPADGFYTFLMEQRGASVTAIEKEPKKGYAVLRELTGCKTDLVIDNVYNISKQKYGSFDIVMFLGVLYHLRNPLLALDRIREVCTQRLYVESHVEVESMSSEVPMARFYPTEELGEDYTNWWGPNLLCMTRMIEASGFKATHIFPSGTRGICIAVPTQDERLEWFIKYDYKFL